MRKFFSAYGYILIVLGIYLSAVFIINPFSEYAVNDDWDFVTHVRNFRSGDFVKNSLIDSSFVLQGFLGLVWTYIFGFSYTSLKVLTVLVTVAIVFGLFKIFDLLLISKKQKIVGSLVFLFNPFVFPFSYTFMTEVFFLFFVIWSLYFYLRYLKTNNGADLFLALFTSSTSILVRQLGLLLFPGYFLAYLFTNRKSLSKDLRYIILSGFVFIIFASISLLWPQYNSDGEMPLDIMTSVIRNPVILLASLPELPFILPYIGICIIVFALPMFFTLPLKVKGAVFAGSLSVFNIFYRINLFRIGNVLYPEGLMLKNNYISHTNLYDSTVFKVIFTFIVVLSFCTVVMFLITHHTHLKNKYSTTLLILTAANVLPIVVQKSYFDRYLVNGLVLFVILCQNTFVKWKNVSGKLEYTEFILLTLFIGYVFSVSQSFHTATRIQWDQAGNIKEARDLKNDIFLSDTYSKYFSVFYKPNGPQITRAMPLGVTYRCYVQTVYSSVDANMIYKLLKRADGSRTLQQILPKPQVFEAKTSAGYRTPTKNPDKILASKPYFSFPDWVVGVKTSVITYCNEPQI